MPDGWQWDPTLFRGSAVYYERGRLPYAPGFAEALARALGLDGRGRLLDVGCGPGTVLLPMARYVTEAVGVDPDEDMLAEAERRARRLGVTNARWAAARAEDLPAGLGTFRAVVFAQSFHWTDRDRVAATVLRMLREGVEIFRQAWTTGTATLDGEFYQVDGAIVRPLPLQEGGIPIWVAGGGEKVTLKIAAQYARYTNFNYGLDGFRQKSELLRAHCETVGTDFEAITRSSNWNTIIGETEAEVRDRIDRLEARWATSMGAERAAEYATNVYREGNHETLVGTPEQIVGTLREREALGLGYSIHNFPEAAWDRSGVELFEREVMPALG